MDKRVILAVAGSGKTTYVVKQLNLEKKSIIITYTNNNYYNLKKSIINKFGFFPENIKLFTYFKFLYSFCYKPFLHSEIKANGINFNNEYGKFKKMSDLDYYQDNFNRLYSSRLSKLLIELDILDCIKSRITKYFDDCFIDEIQDFGGNDFNFIMKISTAKIKYLFVGDYYQHTYDTSRDGNVNKNLHSNYDKYVEAFKKNGFTVDFETLIKSWRCSPTVCKYVVDNLQINIESNRNCETKIEHISNLDEIEAILKDDNIVKLFYQKHYDYNCHSRNWGDSKGEDKYNDVCVVLNRTTFNLSSTNKLHELAPISKNKFYVAITRTRNNLFFVPQDLINTLYSK